jgi:heme/copper-type cytochrome/quinol oxidase subunit 3
MESAPHAPVAWPLDAQFGRASAGKIGMWIFLLSDALCFAGLLVTYGMLRGGSSVWRNPGEPPLGIPFTALLTFLLVCSSVTMVFAHDAALNGQRKRAAVLLGLTALGGALFLLGQYAEYVGILHPGLTKEGLVFGRSAYASTFYVITGFHGMHVFSGVVYLVVTLARWLRSSATAAQIELLGLFWHFVDLIWIFVFAVVYLMPVGDTAVVLALIALAVAQAACVALYFMNLKRETRWLKLTVAIPLLTAVIYALVLISEAAWRRLS